jgi:hypothetical protein
MGVLVCYGGDVVAVDAMRETSGGDDASLTNTSGEM